MSCPNKNILEYKHLESQGLSSFDIQKLYNANNNNIPNVQNDLKIHNGKEVSFQEFTIIQKNKAIYNNRLGTNHIIENSNTDGKINIAITENWNTSGQKFKNNTDFLYKDSFPENEVLPDGKHYINKDGDSNPIDNLVLPFQETPQRIFFSPKGKSISDNVKSYVDRIQSRLNTVRNTIEKEKDFNTKERLKERRATLIEQIEKATDFSTASTIIDIAKEHLSYVESLVSEDSISHTELRDAFRYLENYLDFTNSFLTEEQKEMVDYIDDSGNISSQKANLWADAENIEANAKHIHNKLMKITKDSIKETAQQSGLSEEGVKDLFTDTKDINWYNKLVLNAGRQGKAILDFLHIIRRTAMAKSDQKATELLTTLKSLASNIKGQDMTIFLQKDSTGNINGNLVNKYSQTYWDARSKYYKDIKSDNAAVRKKANDWYRENHTIIDISKFINPDTGVIDEDALDIYREELRTEIGSGSEELVEDALNKAKAYFIERQNKIEYILADKTADYEATDEFKKELGDWELENSPFERIESIKSKTSKKLSNGKYPIFEGYDFMRITPKNINGNFDKNYEIIENNPALLEFHEFFNKLSKDYFSIIPQSFISHKGIQSNFIPVVLKDWLQKTKTEGTQGFMQGASQFLVDSIAEYADTNVEYEEVSLKNGTASKSLPIYLMSRPTKYNPETKQEIYDIEKQSFDLVDIARSLIAVSTVYEQKSKMEATFTLAKKTIESINEDTGKVDELGNPLPPDTTGLNNLKAIANHEERLFYGVGKKKMGVTNKEVKSKEQKEEIEALDKAIEETTDLEEKERLAEIRERKQKGIKVVSFGQILNSSLNWLILKSQAFNVMSATTESIFGNISALTHAQGGRDFNTSQFFKAQKLTITRNKKAKEIFHKYKIQTQLSEGDTQNWFSKAANFLNETAESSNKQNILIASMMNTIILDKDGNNITLYDAYDEDGNWKSELFNDEVNADWNPFWDSNTNNIGRNKFYTFRDKTVDLSNRLYGNYDRDSQLMVQETPLGRALLTYKRWIFEGVAARFGEESSSELLGRRTKGRYLTIMKIYEQKGIGGVLKQFGRQMIFDPKAFEGFEDELDIENMRKNLAEMYTLASLFLFFQLLALMAGDDEEDERVLGLNFLMNTTLRLQSDIMYYFNPSEAKNLSQNLIPVLKLYDDIADVGTATLKTLNGDSKIHNGVFKDWNSMGKEIGELTPGVAQGMAFYKQSESILNKR